MNEREPRSAKPAKRAAEPAAGRDGEGFEALYARLEAVSQQLEAGELTLEQSLALYEEGMTLARRCQELLAGVEQRIETLRQGAASG